MKNTGQSGVRSKDSKALWEESKPMEHTAPGDRKHSSSQRRLWAQRNTTGHSHRLWNASMTKAHAFTVNRQRVTINSPWEGFYEVHSAVLFYSYSHVILIILIIVVNLITFTLSFKLDNVKKSYHLLKRKLLYWALKPELSKQDFSILMMPDNPTTSLVAVNSPAYPNC